MRVKDLPPQAVSAPLTPLEMLFWFVIPAGLLVWLALNPPHALDLALARAIRNAFAGAWLHTKEAEFWLHFLPKAASIAVYGGVLAAVLASLLKKRHSRAANDVWSGLLRARLLYALAGGALCVIIVWWLKKTTGVSCPWSIAEFGGEASITNPQPPFAFRPGVCWPSGAAGSGFCLLPLFFMLRGFPRSRAYGALFLALFLGLAAGIGRMLSGAHFFSHVVDAFLIDWLAAAGLYAAVFCRRGFFTALAKLFRPFPRTPENPQTGLRIPFYVLALGLGLWWAFVFDAPMLMKLLAPEGTASISSAILMLSSGAAFALVGAGLVVLLSLLPGIVFRTLLVLLNILGALAFAAAFLYGTAMTPDMVRSFLATDPAESAGYVGVRSILIFLWALIAPLWLSLKGELPRQDAPRGSPRAALKRFSLRCAAALLLAILGVAAIAFNFQSFSSAMRNDKTLRYQIAPVNILYSALRTCAADESPDAKRVRLVTDNSPKATVKVKRTAVFVFVVGETARAANWELNGYDRETNPELRKIKLINFPKVTACGTSTDVSLPCMMSRIGRSNYQRDRILAEESLPALLERAGMNVLWIDNQSGCKGTCDGVPARTAHCTEGRCKDDEVLLRELERELPRLPADRPSVIFLHMIGSHGPAYWERSPDVRKALGITHK